MSTLGLKINEGRTQYSLSPFCLYFAVIKRQTTIKMRNFKPCTFQNQKDKYTKPKIKQQTEKKIYHNLKPQNQQQPISSHSKHKKKKFKSTFLFFPKIQVQSLPFIFHHHLSTFQPYLCLQSPHFTLKSKD